MSDHTDTTLTDTERALIADSMPFPTTDREWATLTRNLESIVAARVAAARADARDERNQSWIAAVRLVLDAVKVDGHQTVDALLPEVLNRARAEAWDEGMHHESDHLATWGQFCQCTDDHNPYRALIEGADQ